MRITYDANGNIVVEDEEDESLAQQRALQAQQAAQSEPVAEVKPRPGASGRGFWGQVGNDLLYEVNNARDALMGDRQARQRLVSLGNQLPRRLEMAGQEASANFARTAIEAGQKLLGQEADYLRTNFGRRMDAELRQMYAAPGVPSPLTGRTATAPITPLQDMGVSERILQDVLSEGAAELGLVILTRGLGNRFLRSRFGAGKVGSAVQWLMNATNPTLAKTRAGGAARLVAGGLATEAAVTPFTDPTGGSAISMVNALLGTQIPDVVQPEDDRVTAALKGLVPNTTLGVAGGSFIQAAFWGLRRVTRIKTDGARVQARRSRLERNGLTQTDPSTGETRFTSRQRRRETLSQRRARLAQEQLGEAAEALEVQEALRRQQEANAGQETTAPNEQPQFEPPAEPVPPADPGAEVIQGPGAGAPGPGSSTIELSGGPEDAAPRAPWFPEGEEPMPAPFAYPVNLPEADDLQGALSELLDPWEKVEVKTAVDGGTPVVEAVQEVLESRELRTEANPIRTYEAFSEPRDAMSPDYAAKYDASEVISAIDNNTLFDMVANSPELSDRITALTGKAPREFTRADIEQGIRGMPEGMLLISNRMGRETPAMMNVDDLAVDVERFQFKMGVDEQGVQAGNSLEGVDGWNPNAEGAVDVWVDPMDGRTYVVNGHNRLALAKRQGIRRLRVNYLVARDARAARVMGAEANIATGGGTPMDAARFLKEEGITTLKELRKRSPNLTDARNLWSPGLALARLPDDVLDMVATGQLDVADGVIIGKSALSPEGMRSTATAAVRRQWKGPQLAEMIAQGEATADMAGKVDQAVLFDTGVEDTTAAEVKADLVVKVRQILKADKRVFGGTAKVAGKLEGRTASKIDRAGTKAIAEQAKSALDTFEQFRYMTGPVADLVSDGAQQILEGANPDAVATRVGAQMPAALDAMMRGVELDTSQAFGGLEKQGSLLDQPATPAGEPMAPTRIEEPYPRPQPVSEVVELEVDSQRQQQRVARWQNASRQQQEKWATEARKQVLTERKRQNRVAKEAELTERTRLADQQAQDDVQLTMETQAGADTTRLREQWRERYGFDWSEEGQAAGGQGWLEAPTDKEWGKLRQELQQDTEARDYLAWYEANVAGTPDVPGTKAEVELLEAELMDKAIENGEVRPPERPVPEPPVTITSDTGKVAADLLENRPTGEVANAVLEELGAREVLNAIDDQLDMESLAAEREATGYQNLTLAEKQEVVTEAFLSDEPIPATRGEPAPPPPEVVRAQDRLAAMAEAELAQAQIEPRFTALELQALEQSGVPKPDSELGFRRMSYPQALALAEAVRDRGGVRGALARALKKLERDTTGTRNMVQRRVDFQMQEASAGGRAPAMEAPQSGVIAVKDRFTQAMQIDDATFAAMAGGAQGPDGTRAMLDAFDALVDTGQMEGLDAASLRQFRDQLAEQNAIALTGDESLRVVDGELVEGETPVQVMGRGEQPKLADVLGQTLRAMAESDARLYRGLGNSLGELKELLDELNAGVAPGPDGRLNQRGAAVRAASVDRAERALKALPPGGKARGARRKLAKEIEKLQNGRSSSRDLDATTQRILDEQIAEATAQIEAFDKALRDGCG